MNKVLIYDVDKSVVLLERVRRSQFVVEPHVLEMVTTLDGVSRRLNDAEFLLWTEVTERKGTFYIHSPFLYTQVATDEECLPLGYPDLPSACIHRHPAGCPQFSGFDDQIVYYHYSMASILLEKGRFCVTTCHGTDIPVRIGQKDVHGPSHRPGFRLDRELLRIVARNQVNGRFFEIYSSGLHVMTLDLGRDGSLRIVEMPYLQGIINGFLEVARFAVILMDGHTVLDGYPLAHHGFKALWEAVKEFLLKRYDSWHEHTVGSIKILCLNGDTFLRRISRCPRP